MTFEVRCQCCESDAAVAWPPGTPRWCQPCFEACQAVRLALRRRLQTALAANDLPAAATAQGALLLLFRGLHPWAPR